MLLVLGPASWCIVLTTETSVFTNADVPRKGISSFSKHDVISFEKLGRQHIYYMGGERKEVREEGKKGERKEGKQEEGGKRGQVGRIHRQKTQQMSCKNINKGDGCSSVKEEIMGVDDDDDNDDSFV